MRSTEAMVNVILGRGHIIDRRAKPTNDTLFKERAEYLLNNQFTILLKVPTF